MLRRKFLACVLALGLALAAPLALAVTEFEGGFSLIQGETLVGRHRIVAIFLVETAGDAGGPIRIREGGASGTVILAGSIGSNDTQTFDMYGIRVNDLYVETCPTGVSVVAFVAR